MTTTRRHSTPRTGRFRRLTAPPLWPIVFDLESAEEPGQLRSSLAGVRIELGREDDPIHMVEAYGDVGAKAQTCQVLPKRRDKRLGALGKSVTLRRMRPFLELTPFCARQRPDVLGE